MFDADIVNQALFGRVGWSDQNPPTLPDGSVVSLSDENKESRSGLRFQYAHGAVTLRNVHGTVEVVNADSATFNQYLTDLQYSAINRSVSAVFNDDTLIEQSLIFNRRSERQTSVQLVATKMGYKINIANDPSYCSVIRNISLLFAESGDIEVVFAHSNAGELMRKVVTVEADVEIVVPVDLSLFYSCGSYKGGFFFVYFETDLLPIEPDYPDFNCTKLFGAHPFEGDDLNDVSLTSRSYGLNMEICAYRDFTQIIRNNQCVFDTLIGLNMAATVIDLIINSTRSNGTERLTKETVNMLYTDLNQSFPTPEFPYAVGIRGQITREVKRVKENMLPKEVTRILTPCFTSSRTR